MERTDLTLFFEQMNELWEKVIAIASKPTAAAPTAPIKWTVERVDAESRRLDGCRSSTHPERYFQTVAESDRLFGPVGGEMRSLAADHGSLRPWPAPQGNQGGRADADRGRILPAAHAGINENAATCPHGMCLSDKGGTDTVARRGARVASHGRR